MLKIKIVVNSADMFSKISSLFSDTIINFKNVTGIVYNRNGSININMEFDKTNINKLALRIGRIEEFANKLDCIVVDGSL